MALNWSPTSAMMDGWISDLPRGYAAEVGEKPNGDWGWAVTLEDEDIDEGTAKDREAAQAAVQNWLDNADEAVGMARVDPQWGDITAPNH